MSDETERDIEAFRKAGFIFSEAQAKELASLMTEASALAALLAQARRETWEKAAAICEARTARFGEDYGIEEGWIVDEALACAAAIRAAAAEDAA